MSSNWWLLLWVAVFGVVIYFFMIRPNKRRQEDQKNMMNAMQPGTRIMLTSGIFGTIQAVGDKQMVIELAPGTAITVVRQAVAKVVTDADEEFEYTDDDSIEPAAPVAAVTDGMTIEPDDSDDKPDEPEDKTDEPVPPIDFVEPDPIEPAVKATN